MIGESDLMEQTRTTQDMVLKKEDELYQYIKKEEGEYTRLGAVSGHLATMNHVSDRLGWGLKRLLREHDALVIG